MSDNLNSFFKDLQDVRNYLIKLGAKRKTSNQTIVKKNNAEEIYKAFNNCLEILCSEENLENYSEAETSLIDSIAKKFNDLYEEILLLCTESVINNSSIASVGSEENIVIMAGEKFDLKIALSILPILNDNEDVTKQLIESIEYYSSVLSDGECNNKLIPFILKTRLSQKAKLKLKSKYENVTDLIKDMRLLLLPQKSHTALQAKLQSCRQQDKSISDFGKELSELFVDLTISQAQGNEESFGVLRPLNEKVAIKRFSDGLRNRRLSTIIAARDFSSLTDAVQAAQDEDDSGPSTAGEIMGLYRPTYRRGGGRSSYGHHGGGGGQGSLRSRSGPYRGWRPNFRGRGQQFQAYPRVSYNNNNFRPRGNRYNYGQRMFRGRQSTFPRQINVHSIEENEESQKKNIEQPLNHFFRT